MRPTTLALAPFLRRWPLLGLAALIALTVLLTGPPVAEAHTGTDGHVHLSDAGAGSFGTNPPGVPTGTAVPGPGVGEIKVDWTPATSGTAVTAFTVKLELSGSPTVEASKGAADRDHTFSGLDVTKTYTILVQAKSSTSGSNFVSASGVKPGVAPAFSSAAVDGTTLTITFSKDLDAAANLANDAFEVKARLAAGGGAFVEDLSTTGPVISGKTVTLTLAGAVMSTDTVTVSYTQPTSGTDNALKDSVGKVASFTDQAVTNNTLPTLKRGDVNGTELLLTFSESLDAGSAPAGSAFAVLATSGGQVRTLNGVGTAVISATRVTVTLSGAARHDDEFLVVRYTKPATSPLRASATKEVATFSESGFVNNNTPSPVPVLSSAAVNGATLTVTFDKDLDTGSAPAGSAFTVDASAEGWGGPARTNIAGTGTAAISGNTATVTLASPAYHVDTVTVSYSKPASDPLQETGGNQVESFNGAAVTNNTPEPALTDDTLTVNGNVLTLTFTEPMDEDSVPATDGIAFRVRTVIGGEGWSTVPVADVSISGHTVTLTLTETIPSRAQMLLIYKRPAWEPLFTVSRFPIGPFTEEVTVLTPDNTAPLFSSASLRPYYPPVWSGGCWRCLPTWDEKAFLWIDLSEVLDKDVVPAASAFRVTVRPPGGGARSVAVTRVVNQGSEISMETGPVPGGQDAKVTVSYVKPSADGLRDRAGNLMESFSGKPVTNGPPRVESMALVSDPGSDRTYGRGERVRVGVTFDGPVSVVTRNGVPRLRIVLGESGGGRWASYEGGHETDTLTFAYTVAGSDSSGDTGVRVVGNSLQLNGGKIGSVYQWPREYADLAHEWLPHNPAHKVDAALPVFESAAVEWKTLVLTFTENLGTDSVPAHGAFRVTVNNARRNVEADGVAISGKTVSLTLASPVSDTDTVQVRYTKPRSNPLRDAGGIAVGTFSDREVTNNTPAGTIWAATLTAGFAADGQVGCWNDATSAIRCSSALNPASFRAGGTTYRFVALLYADTATPSFIIISDKAIRSDWTLQVNGHQLRVADATLSNSNKTATWGNLGFTWTAQHIGQQVSLHLTAPVPVFESAAVDWRTLTATFAANLDTDSVPSPGAFHVTVNNARRNVASDGVAISGKTVSLTLASPVSDTDTVKVRYTRPSRNPLQGAGGIAVGTFSDREVTNNTPAGTIWAATLTAGFAADGQVGCWNDATSAIRCSSALNPASFRAGGTTYRFVALLYADTATPSFIIISDKAIRSDWTLQVNGHQLRVADATLSNSNKTATWGNLGFTWTAQHIGQQVSLHLTAPVPVFESAAVDWRTLTATFAANLDTDSVPSPGAFHVTVNNARRNVASDGVAISGKTVSLTLASPVSDTDTVKVRYTRPSRNPLQGAGGIAVGTFSDREVTNNTPAGTIWAATLTAGFAADGQVGCWNDATSAIRCSSALNPASFRAGGTTYRFVALLYADTATPSFIIISDKAIRSDWTLQVNGHQLRVADATLSNSNKTATWGNLGFTWTAQHIGQQVSLHLTAPVPDSVASGDSGGGDPASVTGVTMISSAGADKTYGLGDTIHVRVTFDGPVDVTGSPRLKIDMDPAEWGEKWAAYQSGSGTSSLTFTHTVVEPNISRQGIAVLANTLDLNGGTIQASGVDADLSHTGQPHDANHKVDWQTEPESGGGGGPIGTSDPPGGGSGDSGGEQSAPASVSGVTITSDPGNDDTYASDDVISITVTFSEAVTVTGAPRLKIDMDPAEWGEKWAAYQGGSGTATLTFTHTVVEPNISTQGIAVLMNSLELNGGTIRGSGVDADLAHTSLAHDADHKVDWQLSEESDTSGEEGGASGDSGGEEEQSAPASVSGVIITSDPGDDDTYASDDVISITLTFSEAVDVTGTPRLKIDLDPAEWGEKWAAYQGGSGTVTLTFTHTVAEPNISTQGIAVLENSLELNGGTIQASGVDATLSHTGQPHDANHKVDWQRQTTTTTTDGLQVSIAASPAHARIGESVNLTASIANAPSDSNPSYNWEIETNGEWSSFGKNPTLSFLADKAESWTFRLTVSYGSGDSATSDPLTVSWTEDGLPPPTSG